MTPLIEIGNGVGDITGLVGDHVASHFLCSEKSGHQIDSYTSILPVLYRVSLEITSEVADVASMNHE
jgi:hypothetical protein